MKRKEKIIDRDIALIKLTAKIQSIIQILTTMLDEIKKLKRTH